MAKKASTTIRREEPLTRDQIVTAAIEILDRFGEEGLTFRALANSLMTGPGNIYWHIDNKQDLLSSACDAVLFQSLTTYGDDRPSAAAIRILALATFDIIDQHPWVGSVLASPCGLRPMVHLLEPLGRHVQALGVRGKTQWVVTSALLNYILGVGSQNATNGRLGRALGLSRDVFLEEIAAMWTQLDPKIYPTTRKLATYVRSHDDRTDFLAGIDLILRGIAAR